MKVKLSEFPHRPGQLPCCGECKHVTVKACDPNPMKCTDFYIQNKAFIDAKLAEEEANSHTYATPEDCTCDGSGGCMICDGGLALCTTCGELEGSLTTDCPGVITFPGMTDLVYNGLFDYRKNEGWVRGLNPTNQEWERRRQLDKQRREQRHDPTT